MVSLPDLWSVHIYYTRNKEKKERKERKKEREKERKKERKKENERNTHKDQESSLELFSQYAMTLLLNQQATDSKDKLRIRGPTFEKD